MLMENRDFLFTQLTIWTSKAMSKEIAVSKSSEAASLASLEPTLEHFGCFLARYRVWMVGQGRTEVQNHRQMPGQHGDRVTGAEGDCKYLE